MSVSYRILHGESLELLRSISDGSVDAVIADPPYSSGGFTRSDRSADPSDKYVQTGVEIIRHSFAGDNRDARSWCYWMALWVSEALRVVRPSGYCLIFTDWRQLPLAADSLQAGGFVWRGVISWDKTIAARAPHKGYFRHQCEYIVWGTNGVSKAADWGGPWPGCLRVPVKQADKHHITGKPVQLMSHLVKCCPPGGVVLDPFAGSGSTGVAALSMGRNFIGIEQEAHYVNVARERMDQVLQQPALLSHG